jgi:hypothetical protein
VTDIYLSFRGFSDNHQLAKFLIYGTILTEVIHSVEYGRTSEGTLITEGSFTTEHAILVELALGAIITIDTEDIHFTELASVTEVDTIGEHAKITEGTIMQDVTPRIKGTTITEFTTIGEQTALTKPAVITKVRDDTVVCITRTLSHSVDDGEMSEFLFSDLSHAVYIL